MILTAKQFKRTHPALSSFSLDAARKKGVGIQRHPGAAKYFTEQGF